jgi:hypothetical protein
MLLISLSHQQKNREDPTGTSEETAYEAQQLAQSQIRKKDNL